jgi:hypothetical protein
VVLAVLVIWLALEEFAIRELLFPQNLFLYSAVAWGIWRLVRQRIN